MDVKRVVQHAAKSLDTARNTFQRILREGIEYYFRNLKKPMVPQHDGRYLENIGEDVLSSRRDAVQYITGIWQGYCHIRAERPQGRNCLVDMDFVPEDKGIHVHLEEVST